MCRNLLSVYAAAVCVWFSFAEAFPQLNFDPKYRFHPLEKSTKFAYQNPIPVAPTLLPDVEIDVDANHGNKCQDQVYLNGVPAVFQRYDNKTGRCFPVRSTEPCSGQNMAFYGDPDNDIYGECDCVHGNGRPRVYNETLNNCYFIYQQAYCKEAEWLVFNEDRQPICEPNKCYELGITLKWNWLSNARSLYTYGIVPLDGGCIRLGYQCKNKEFVSFPSGELFPRCVKNEYGFWPEYWSDSLECRPGSKLQVTGKCGK